VDCEVDAGARHHLPFEGVTMQVHDTGQHLEPARVELERAMQSALAYPAILDRERCFQGVAVEQGVAALNQNIGHDAALLLAGCEPSDTASYLSRNSSMASLRKSGSARRRVS